MNERLDGEKSEEKKKNYFVVSSALDFRDLGGLEATMPIVINGDSESFKGALASEIVADIRKVSSNPVLYYCKNNSIKERVNEEPDAGGAAAFYDAGGDAYIDMNDFNGADQNSESLFVKKVEMLRKREQVRMKEISRLRFPFEIELDLIGKKIFVKGKQIKLPSQPFLVFACFLQNMNQENFIPFSTIYEKVFGGREQLTVLVTQKYRINKQLKPFGLEIKAPTPRRSGYVLVENKIKDE